jgi:hypothetical protein
MTGPVIWNVTQDILDAFSGEPFEGFLVRKAREDFFGYAWYYSREGAALAADLNLAPRLLLIYDTVLERQTGDPGLYVSANIARVPVATDPGGESVAPYDTSYPAGSQVTLTAPQAFNGRALTGWRVDGEWLPSVDPIDVTLDDDTFVEAVYDVPSGDFDEDGLENCLLLVPQDRNASVLSISSSLPDVPVELSQADLCGHAGGSGDFERLFLQGDLVTITAPASFGGHRFVRWVINGNEQPKGQATTTIVLLGEVHSAVAVYDRRIAAQPEQTPSGRLDRARLP